MRFKNITIKNFRKFDETGSSINLDLVTQPFEPNMGDSPINQALHLMKKILCRSKTSTDGIDTSVNVLNIDSFTDYVHLHDKDRVVNISFTLSPATPRLHESSLLESLQLPERDNYLDSLSNFLKSERMQEITASLDAKIEALASVEPSNFSVISAEEFKSEAEKGNLMPVVSSVITVEDLKSRVEKIMRLFDNAVEPVMHFVETILPSIPLEQQRFGVQRLRALHDMAVSAMEQFAEAEAGVCASMSHEQQEAMLDTLAKNYGRIFRVAKMFSDRAQQFVRGEIWEDVRVGMSIYFDKESCEIKHHITCSFSSDSGYPEIESPELCENSKYFQYRDNKLFRINKNIGKLRANDFLSNNVVPAIPSDGEPKCGERVTAWESFKRFDTQEKYFAIIRDLDNVLYEGEETNKDEGKAYDYFREWLKEVLILLCPDSALG